MIEPKFSQKNCVRSNHREYEW